MAGILQKMAPMVVVAAVFAWCCWPYIMSADPMGGSEESGDGITVTKSLLNPVLNAGHERNPFASAERAAQQLLDSADVNVDETASSKARVAKPATSTTDAEAAASTVSAGNGESNLLLQATLVQGERRMAIINGQVRGSGDRLDTGASASKSWVVSEILPEKVVLRRGREIRTLTYSVATTNASRTANQGERRTTDETHTNTTNSQNKPSDDSLDTMRAGITSVKDLMRVLQQAQTTGESP